uniref:Uncharacterized protein n=1 Tax=Anaerolinea thermolimosa TaxID=229919 RepID=A0A7C4PKV7_9CHLR
MTLSTPDKIQGLEQHLKRSLRPVTPDPEFINRLHDRLVTPKPEVESVALDSKVPLFIMLVISSLAFLIWAIRQMR